MVGEIDLPPRDCRILKLGPIRMPGKTDSISGHPSPKAPEAGIRRPSAPGYLEQRNPTPIKGAYPTPKSEAPINASDSS